MVNATAKDDEVVPLGMMGVSWGGTLIEQVRKRYYPLRHFVYKTIDLPRQARDKRRESTQKNTRVFS